MDTLMLNTKLPKSIIIYERDGKILHEFNNIESVVSSYTIDPYIYIKDNGEVHDFKYSNIHSIELIY